MAGIPKVSLNIQNSEKITLPNRGMMGSRELIAG
jgi:hypothetical protein